MTNKYVNPRIDQETHKNFKIKQKKMQEVFKTITGKNRRIPLTKVMKIASAQPIFLSDQELVKYIGKRRRI